MNLLDIFKKKHVQELKMNNLDMRLRRQLNMMVDWRLCETLKALSKQLTVPRNVIGEHIIEVGVFYVATAMENEVGMRRIRDHAINSHLLDNGLDDSEATLRLGEAGGISDLLAQAGNVLRRWDVFQNACRTAQKTRSVEYLDRCEKDLLRASVGMAMWMEKQGLFDQPDEKEVGRPE
jgi:hypothetical protein